MKFIVCDQDTINKAVYKGHGVTADHPSFSVDYHKVYSFFDPHLLKSLRNDFRKYDIKIDNNIMSWKYVDQLQSIRLAPKLTIKHIEKQALSDMRVSVAAQALSCTVAAGIFYSFSIRFSTTRFEVQLN